MALTNEQKQIINANLRALDYQDGSGVFPRPTREADPNSRFLIIGYGGTGCDALYKVKEQLKKELSPEDFKDRVRILAIDTDRNAQYFNQVQSDGQNIQQRSQRNEKFASSEFLWLDAGPARNVVSNDQLEGINEWINPDLLERIKAELGRINNQGATTYLDGNGASALRQIGRLILCPSVTRDSLNIRITTLVNDLTNSNHDALKVLFLTGISGGTGSGIVIDATYLIRHYIRETPAFNGGNRHLSFTGFILLPPTGAKSVVDAGGDRNGYAALKEIDYYMTLSDRDMQYEQRFGFDTVIEDSKLFDTCYLIDGSITGMGFPDPRARAMEVTTDSILDIVTSLQTVGANNAQGQASSLSNAPTNTEVMVRSTASARAPRDANYIYCALGHTHMTVPLDLLKGYVAKKVFDRIRDLFTNCNKVTDNAVKTFLEKAGCPEGGMFGAAVGQEELENNIIDLADAAFKDTAGNRGPYYVVNLLKKAVDEVKNRIGELNGRALANNRTVRLSRLHAAQDLMTDMNNSCFDVYTFVIEQMQQYMDQAYDIVTNQWRTANSYYYEPVHLGSNEQASRAVEIYLDRLVNDRTTGDLCQKLVDQMIDKRAEWTNLFAQGDADQRFNAAEQIKEFWANGIGGIVKTTLENYLIKYYSEDPNAEWKVDQTTGEPLPQSDEAMRKAAAALVNQLITNGQSDPLVSLNTAILPLNSYTHQRYLLIPHSAKNLKQYVEQQIRDQAGDGNIPADLHIEFSGSDDRVSCYTQYIGIPAFALNWAERKGEPAYESLISQDGTHMSETKGGNNWRNFPNLVNRTVWPLLPGNYFNTREAAIADRVGGCFDRALSLGLTESSALPANNNYDCYSILLLPQGNELDGALFKAVDTERVGSPAWRDAEDRLNAAAEAKARELFEQVGATGWEQMEVLDESKVARALENRGILTYDRKRLQYHSTVMTEVEGAPKPAGWDEDLARKLLRMDLVATDRLRGTVLVMEKLYPMIEAVQARKHNLEDFARYLTAGLIKQDMDDPNSWQYIDTNGDIQSLARISAVRSPAQAKVKEYVLFKKYEEGLQFIRPAMEMQMKKFLTPTPAEIAEKGGKPSTAREALIDMKMDMLTQKAGTLSQELGALLDINSQGSIRTPSFEANATAAGLDINEVRRFYRDLIGNGGNQVGVLQPDAFGPKLSAYI